MNKDFLDALTSYDAAQSRARTAERRLSTVLRSLCGFDGVNYRHRNFRPISDGKVSVIVLTYDPVNPSRPKPT